MVILKQAICLRLRKVPGDEIATGGDVILPVGGHQMVKRVTLHLLAALLLPSRCAPRPVSLHQRRGSERLSGEALYGPLWALAIERGECACLSGKHKETQAHAIGRTGRFLIHQAWIVNGRRPHAATDLHGDEGEAEKHNKCHHPSNRQRGKVGRGQGWRLPVQQRLTRLQQPGGNERVELQLEAPPQQQHCDQCPHADELGRTGTARLRPAQLTPRTQAFLFEGMLDRLAAIGP